MNKKEHPLHRRWKGIMDRCYSKKHSRYRYYGAKGITVCDRWHDFWSFIEDVDNHLENGYLLYESPDWQLDKDKNGGNEYSLENCVVISAEENKKIAYEKQQRKVLAFSETKQIEFKSVTEASEILNIKRTTLTDYLKKGKQHSCGYRFKYCS
ncbi:hypothetical protein NYE67_10950 [Solibacillus sp. FSL W8-0474]|uniref:hypothetical protein n=1 Tax=Solibacillus sp. FSL W8-0474 TaxID=2975336 RepID=UPI0030F95304